MAYKNQEDANAYQRRWRLAHPDRSRATSRKHYWAHRERNLERSKRWFRRNRYGLSEEAYQALIKVQEGFCAICGIALEIPNVDHDHITKEVRGLLCQSCNHLLGNAKDDPAILLRAAFYLTRQLDL